MAAGSHVNWSKTPMDEEHRTLLDNHICEYLIRKNMNQTAEIFTKEANVSFTKTPIEVINPPEGMLSKWWKTNYEQVGFFKEIMQMQKNQPLGTPFEAKGKQMLGGKQDLNASQSRRHSMMQPINQLQKNFSSTISSGTKQMEPTELHGSKHEVKGSSSSADKMDLLTSKLKKCMPITNAKIIHQLEPVFHELEKKEKPAYGDAEMNHEIQHLIDTFWEVDNCPPPLFGEITREGTRKVSPPRKLQRVHQITDLFSEQTTDHGSKF